MNPPNPALTAEFDQLMTAERLNGTPRPAAKRTEPLPPKPAGKGDQLPPLRTYRGQEHLTAPKRQHVIKGLMGAGELGVWHGPPKSGKSMLVTDAALAIAAGAETWMGRRVKRRGVVLYLVMEGASGFSNRLEAWSQHHGRPVPYDFVWSPERLSFMADPTIGNAAADVARIRAKVAELEADGEEVVLIVIDTAARAMTGADENSAQDMGRFIDQCAILQELPSLPHVLVVHHENAQGTKTRGSTALPGGGNIMIKVRRGEKKGDPRTWAVDLAKDDPETEPEGFDLLTISLGTDEDGDEITSCVVVPAAAPEAVKREVGPKLTPQQQIVLDCLHKAIIERPIASPPSQGIARDAVGTSAEAWMDAALLHLKTGADEKQGFRLRESIKRTMDALQAKRIVNREAGFCWPS